MNGARILLEVLKGHDVEYVFGLPGETTLPLYVEWYDFPHIRHILARDERSAAYMADAYSRVTNKPGVCEGPSVGATHFVPGVTEAYKAYLPMILITTDIPLHMERWNMLTGFDQTSLYKGITKATYVITRADDISGIVRRAFRCATTGVPGPVHIRVPMDVLEETREEPDLRADPRFGVYPGARPRAEKEKIAEALTLLFLAQRALRICGQGVLYSQAWDEVTQLAELLGIPVATTMTGKGSIAESHRLSIGVIGGRGGTSFSNRVLEEADVIFFVGSNTDSAGTNGWTLPPLCSDKQIIHLDISEGELGNAYSVAVPLLGDAKATLSEMIDLAHRLVDKASTEDVPWVSKLYEEQELSAKAATRRVDAPNNTVHPLELLDAISRKLPDRYVIVADPGVSAIYVSAFHKVRKAGRRTLFNYAMGALGYAMPASIGAAVGRPDDCIVCLTGDGSFGFCAGELETLSRLQSNVKIFLYDNGCYGWIQAALRFSYSSKYFATQFGAVDYPLIAEGFGVRSYSIEGSEAVDSVLEDVFKTDGPAFVRVRVQSEAELVPPVPSWAKAAEGLGVPVIY